VAGADTLPPADQRSGDSGAPRAGLTFRQYELIRELGRGAMGQVFLARDRKLARKVAIKFLNIGGAGNTHLLLSEARATARCNHESIVVLYDADEYLGKPFLVLEYLEGRSLGELVRQGRRIAPQKAAELLVPVVKALIRAHEFGIVHRDLKPDNIFLCDSGATKVLDFGIAKLLTGLVAGSDAALTAVDAQARRSVSVELGAATGHGGVLGTPAYMAPEQWRGETVDPRTDIWAVGMILFELVVGQHPLAPRTEQELKELVTDATRPLPSVSARIPDLPGELALIIEGCLARPLEDRFPSARTLLKALRGFLPSRDPAELFGGGEGPYPGLTPFTERDAALFFGRGRDVTRLAAQLDMHPLVAIVGPSGAGKSSFVRAGLIPALKRSGEPWERFVVRPGRDPLGALASVLHESGPASDAGEPSPGASRRALALSLAREPGSLGTHLRALAARKRGSVLLFVDQFEELYTQVEDPATRQAFLACLRGAADDASAPVRVVLALRSDFLDRVAEDRRFAEELTRGLFLLQSPGREDLAETLRAPAELAGFELEDESLVSEMLDGLEGAAAALPLLQFTASRLWERRDVERKLLTREAFLAMGGIDGALASHADAVLQRLPGGQRRLARELLLRLTTAEGTRAITDLEELLAVGGDRAEARRVIDHLSEARLLVVQTSGVDEGATAELVHESLIHNWPTLRRWLDESQEHAAFLEQLRAAARQWVRAGRPTGLLWRGEAMQEARRFSRRYDGELSTLERSYLQAVNGLATRAARIRRTVVAAVIVGLLLVVAVGAVALVRIRRAERQAKGQTAVIRKQERRARQAERTAKKRYEQLMSEQKAKRLAELEASRAKTTVKHQREKLSTKDAELALSNTDLKRALRQAREATRQAQQALRVASAAKGKAEKVAGEMKRLAERERLAKLRYQRLLAEEKARARQRKQREKQIEKHLR